MPHNLKITKQYILDRIVYAKNGCWNWNRYRDAKGYGKITLKEPKEKAQYWVASRLTWVLWHGEIPEGMLVCHKCDNSSCCNPGHLFLGTHQDNVNDCIAKNRSTFGFRNPNSKLRSDTLVKVLADDRCSQIIAGEYGLHKSSVDKIKNWQRYRCEIAAILAQVMFWIK